MCFLLIMSDINRPEPVQVWVLLCNGVDDGVMWRQQSLEWNPMYLKLVLPADERIIDTRCECKSWYVRFFEKYLCMIFTEIQK